MNIITGYRGEPHITSAQDRAGNQGSYGTGSYVLDVGNKLAATISSSNEIRIADGAICHQGCLANIDAGTYDSVSINNGAQGVNRIDLIVARYTKNSKTSVESIDLVVIQGSSVSGTPSAPSYRTGNIQNGDSPVDMPLYQVRLTGVTLSSVTKVFNTVKTQAELQADVSTLNGNSIRVALSSATSAITVPSAYLIADPVRKTVRIYITFRSASDISVSTTIVNIPSNYRPKAGNMPLIGFFSTSSIYGISFYGTCDANGNVRQTLGNTVREGILMGEYSI